MSALQAILGTGTLGGSGGWFFIWNICFGFGVDSSTKLTKDSCRTLRGILAPSPRAAHSFLHVTESHPDVLQLPAVTGTRTLAGICAGYSGLLLVSDPKNSVTQVRSITLHLYVTHVYSLHHCIG